MKNNYRNALDKIKLDDSVKERAKNLFYETAPPLHATGKSKVKLSVSSTIPIV